MIHIEVELHTNQYEACAWGNHHSEGVIDWPPSPWRILRSLVAGSYNVRLSDKYQPTLKALLHKLASALPSFTLPPTTYIQHRSPRPQVNPKTAKVEPGKTLYSAGLLMSKERNKLYIHWPVTLSETEELVLTLCLSGLTYLGRKESVATFTLVEKDIPSPNSEIDPTGNQIIAVPDSSLDENALWDALNLSAHENYAVNRSAVFPGVTQATYRVERFKQVLASDRNGGKTYREITLSVSASPQLPMYLTLNLTDRLHKILAKISDNFDLNPDKVSIFTGLTVDKEPRPDHNHAILQCIPDEGDKQERYVKLIRLYRPSGFDDAAIDVITAACTNIHGVVRECDVKLSLADLSDRNEQSAVWESLTPFFLSRFPATRRGKPRMLTERYQKDGAEHQALQYLQYLSWLGLEGDSNYQDDEDGLALYLNGEKAVVACCMPFDHFWLWKSDCRQGKKAGRVGYRVYLKFAKPVSAPIILGYASHYGLGAMKPSDEFFANAGFDVADALAV